MIVRQSLVALIFCLLGSISLSQTSHAQWYVSGNVGAAFVSDSDVSFSDPSIPASFVGEMEFDPGFGLNAAMGYGFARNIRAEVEISYRMADIDTLSGTGTIGNTTLAGSGSVDGHVNSLGFMANLWYDFDTGTKWIPFAGGGVGAANVDAEVAGIEADDTVFAYQAGAGIGYRLNNNLILSLGYRYFGTSDPEFDGVEAEVGVHNIEAGLRFEFQ